MQRDLPLPAPMAPADDPAERARIRVRTVWISDLHLGTPGCRADALLDFLRQVDCERLYLVGDIIDGWQLRRSWYWPQSHNDVVRKLLRKARKGTQVIYVPDNHDEFAVTDAWAPQVNGVVTSLVELVQGVRRLGHEVQARVPASPACQALPVASSA